MANLRERLKLLTSLGPEAAEATLAGALPHASPEEVTPIAAALVGLQRWQSLVVLIRHYHQLDAQVRDMLRRAPRQLLGRAVSQVLNSGSESAIRAALTVINDLEDSALAHLAAVWVRSQDPETSIAASKALLRMARVCRSTPTAFEQFDRALAPVVANYDSHRREEVLLAAALQLPFPGHHLAAVLADSTQPALLPLRALVRRAEDNQLRERLLSLLRCDAVSGAVRTHLTDFQDDQRLEEILHQVHIGMAPTIRSELRRLERPQNALPATLNADDISEEAQPGYGRYLAALKFPERVRVAKLSDAIAFSSPLARLVCLQQLLGRGTPEADRACVHFCFDGHPTIARLATRYTIRRDPGNLGDAWRGVRKLRRSPHRGVRLEVICSPTTNDGEFDAAWDLALRGRSVSAFVLARRALERDASSVVHSLRNRLLGGERKHRLLAILMARQLKLVRQAELELLAVLTGDDHRVVAGAVTALADVESPASADALAACLHHEDARVQANAVEAIDRRLPWTGAVEALIHACEPIRELSESDNNRTRANALRTMLRTGCARPRQVAEMLDDPRPLHRVSGLWLVGRLGLREVASEVVAMTRERESGPVRARAKVVTRRLRFYPRTAVPIADVPNAPARS